MATILGRRALRPLVALRLVGVRTIYGKEMRETIGVPPRPPPFPWRDKTYHMWTSWWDTTSDRLDDNSKVVVVDGPPGIGKTKLAKELAEDLDMEFFPEVTMDDWYVNAYGYDMRQLDPDLPPAARSFDHRDFCRDPTHLNAGSFQLMMYSLRLSQYVDALAHLMNTGQGVVLERGPHSDFVFLEAMRDCSFVSAGVKSVYADVRLNTIHELLRPHLCVYLDAPVDVVQKRIRERDLEHERDSKALTPQFLGAVEKHYKRTYLKDVSAHAELLVYDWSTPGDTETVVEDIERIDFDKYDKKSTKMKDWRFHKEQALNDARKYFTNHKMYLMQFCNVARYDVPELMLTGDEERIYNDVWYSAPGNKWEKGFNSDMGDTGLVFKSKGAHRDKYF